MTDRFKITIPPTPPSTRYAMRGEQISRYQGQRVLDVVDVIGRDDA